VLLVGTDGQITPEQPDLFDPPAAAVAALEHWQLSINAMPGAMVQGVLAQSLTMGHWLTPASGLMTTLLAAGLGVLIAAYRELRRPRVWLVLVSCLAWTVIGYQLMISAAVLIPLVLPMAALATVALIRKD
jgi:CHASE2 domain-containing sensor protein